MADETPEKARTEELATPEVDGFKVKAKRLKNLDELATLLSPLNFLEIAKEADMLTVISVESRDIKRRPYLFSLLYLKPDEIEFIYTVLPTSSPRKRRIEAMKFFLNIITLIEPAYEIEHRQLYQIAGFALSDITEFASSEYNDIFAKYDRLLVDNAELKKKYGSLTAGNELLAKTNNELRAKNDELTLKINKLESYSDDVLMVKVQEWLETHNNEINLSDFARVYKVSEPRVEQILNRMVVEGYLEPKS